MTNPRTAPLLADQVAIVTGGASGIGRAICELFAREGASVAIVDRDLDSATEVIQSLGPRSRSVALQADIANAEQAQSAVRAAVGQLGRLNILVNNAGIICRKSVVDSAVEDWDRVLAVNLRGVYLMSKFAIPEMRKSGGGVILNTGSGWGLKGGGNAAAYCASKGAVVNLTRAMAIDHARDHIRVNCVCPGDTDTSLLRSECAQLGGDINEFLRDAAERPLRRVGRPEEIAEAFLYLASERASFVTGAILAVDGGGTA